jgi:hypothetical protein
MSLEPDIEPSQVELEIQAKHRAHAAFDPIWRNGRMTRKAAYAWLAKQLGTKDPVHIKDMGVAECERVVRICLRYKHGRRAP